MLFVRLFNYIKVRKEPESQLPQQPTTLHRATDSDPNSPGGTRKLRPTESPENSEASSEAAPAGAARGAAFRSVRRRRRLRMLRGGPDRRTRASAAQPPSPARLGPWRPACGWAT